jgi:L-fucose isomerase-like protein
MTIMKPVIGFAAMAGEFEVGFKEAGDLYRKSVEQFVLPDFDIVRSEEVIFDNASVKKAARIFKEHDIDILCVCVGTWSEDHHLLDLLEYCERPVILWAYPAIDTGSLCGVQQICCVLKELGKPYFYVYGDPENKAVLNKIKVIVRAVTAVNRLRFVKIGTIGGRVRGMTETAYDEFEIKRKTGARIVNISVIELMSGYENSDKTEAQRKWKEIKNSVSHVTCEDEQGSQSVRYYLSMKSLINKYELEGLTVNCYPDLMGKICLGYSLLSEEGIVCGCEGDVNNTVTMKILFDITGMPVHNTDLLYPDQGLNTILFSHCGSSGFSTAGKKEEICLAPVRLCDTGVCALFPAKKGKVTLVNLVGRSGTYRMSVMTGEAIECGMEFPGNPFKVKFDNDVNEINRKIASEGIGHHWIGCYGDVSGELEIFCDLKGIRYIGL